MSWHQNGLKQFIKKPGHACQAVRRASTDGIPDAAVCTCGSQAPQWLHRPQVAGHASFTRGLRGQKRTRRQSQEAALRRRSAVDWYPFKFQADRECAQRALSREQCPGRRPRSLASLLPVGRYSRTGTLLHDIVTTCHVHMSS